MGREVGTAGTAPGGRAAAPDGVWGPFLAALHGCAWYRELERAALTGLSLYRRAVLEVGCGLGYLARDMTRRGAHVTGVDPNPEIRQAAAARCPGARFVAGHTNRLPGGVWDIGVMLNVLHLSDDPAHAVALLATRVRGPVRFVVGRHKLSGGAAHVRRTASRAEHQIFQQWRAVLRVHPPPDRRILHALCAPHLHHLHTRDLDGIATLVCGEAEGAVED